MAIRNANHNVVGLTDDEGEPAAWFGYTPYGELDFAQAGFRPSRSLPLCTLCRSWTRILESNAPQRPRPELLARIARDAHVLQWLAICTFFAAAITPIAFALLVSLLRTNSGRTASLISSALPMKNTAITVVVMVALGLTEGYFLCQWLACMVFLITRRASTRFPFSNEGLFQSERDKNRCPHCAYSREGLVQWERCPECGAWPNHKRPCKPR